MVNATINMNVYFRSDLYLLVAEHKSSITLYGKTIPENNPITSGMIAASGMQNRHTKINIGKRMHLFPNLN